MRKKYKYLTRLFHSRKGMKFKKRRKKLFLVSHLNFCMPMHHEESGRNPDFLRRIVYALFLNEVKKTWN